MPLAIAPCQIHEIPETGTLHCFVRKRNVRHGSRAARRQLTECVLNKLSAEPEHLQKCADLLKFMERALACGGGVFSFSTVRHKRHAESRAGAADGAMNANCSLICHGVSFNRLGGLPFYFRNVYSLFSHFVERGKLTELGDDLHHLFDDVVDFFLRIETAEAKANRRVSQVFADP